MGYMKIRPITTHAKWQKHTYINLTPYEIELLDCKDQFTHLTTFPPKSTYVGYHDTQTASTIYISRAITTDQKKYFFFCPED